MEEIFMSASRPVCTPATPCREPVDRLRASLCTPRFLQLQPAVARQSWRSRAGGRMPRRAARAPEGVLFGSDCRFSASRFRQSGTAHSAARLWPPGRARQSISHRKGLPVRPQQSCVSLDQPQSFWTLVPQEASGGRRQAQAPPRTIFRAPAQECCGGTRAVQPYERRAGIVWPNRHR